MGPVDVRFELKRETDGALRYAELNHLGQRIRRLDDGIIGTLYLRKRAVEGIPKQKPWWDIHLSGDDDQLGLSP